MIKHIAIAALFGGLLSGAAYAQTSPPMQPSPAQSTPAPGAPPASAQPSTGAAPAEAAAAPQNPDECMQAASDLAQSAEEKKLAENKLDKIEDLLTKMETHCDAKQFVEAMGVAKDIKSMIETN